MNSKLKVIEDLLISLEKVRTNFSYPTSRVSNGAFEELVDHSISLLKAFYEAQEAMKHTIDSTGGYTGGKPQAWLDKWCK